MAPVAVSNQRGMREWNVLRAAGRSDGTNVADMRQSGVPHTAAVGRKRLALNGLGAFRDIFQQADFDSPESTSNDLPTNRSRIGLPHGEHG